MAEDIKLSFDSLTLDPVHSGQGLDTLSEIGKLMRGMKRKLRKLEQISGRNRITKSQEERFIEYASTIVADKLKLEDLLKRNNRICELNVIEGLQMPTFNGNKEYKYQVVIHEIDNVMKIIHDKNKMCSHVNCKRKAHFGKDTCLDHSSV
jgi:hypothetical protein